MEFGEVWAVNGLGLCWTSNTADSTCSRAHSVSGSLRHVHDEFCTKTRLSCIVKGFENVYDGEAFMSSSSDKEG